MGDGCGGNCSAQLSDRSAFYGSNNSDLADISAFICAIVWHVLLYSGRSDRFERFLVPYFWIGNLVVVLFGLILILGQMISPALAQIVTIPIVVWIGYGCIARLNARLGLHLGIAFILGDMRLRQGWDWLQQAG